MERGPVEKFLYELLDVESSSLLHHDLEFLLEKVVDCIQSTLKAHALDGAVTSSYTAFLKRLFTCKAKPVSSVISAFGCRLFSAFCGMFTENESDQMDLLLLLKDVGIEIIEALEASKIVVDADNAHVVLSALASIIAICDVVDVKKVHEILLKQFECVPEMQERDVLKSLSLGLVKQMRNNPSCVDASSMLDGVKNLGTEPFLKFSVMLLRDLMSFHSASGNTLPFSLMLRDGPNGKQTPSTDLINLYESMLSVATEVCRSSADQSRLLIALEVAILVLMQPQFDIHRLCQLYLDLSKKDYFEVMLRASAKCLEIAARHEHEVNGFLTEVLVLPLSCCDGWQDNSDTKLDKPMDDVVDGMRNCFKNSRHSSRFVSLSVSLLGQPVLSYLEKEAAALLLPLLLHVSIHIGNQAQDGVFLQVPLQCRILELACHLATVCELKWWDGVNQTGLLGALVDLLDSQHHMNVQGSCCILRCVSLCFAMVHSPPVTVASRQAVVACSFLVKDRLSHPAWEVRDSAVEVLTELTKLLARTDELAVLEDLGVLAAVFECLIDCEAYVRAAALQFFQVAYSIENLHPVLQRLDDQVLTKVINICTNDTEAVSRRAAVKTLAAVGKKCDNPRVAQCMSQLIFDLDWEVKLNSLDYWNIPKLFRDNSCCLSLTDENTHSGKLDSEAIGWEVSACIDALQNGLDDYDTKVRQRSAEILKVVNVLSDERGLPKVVEDVKIEEILKICEVSADMYSNLDFVMKEVLVLIGGKGAVGPSVDCY